MEQRDEIRTSQLQELRTRMDRALTESARDEGADGERFIQEMIGYFDTKHGAKAGWVCMCSPTGRITAKAGFRAAVLMFGKEFIRTRNYSMMATPVFGWPMKPRGTGSFEVEVTP